MSFYVSTATFFLLHCDEWDRIVALPRHKFVTGATLLQLTIHHVLLHRAGSTLNNKEYKENLIKNHFLNDIGDCVSWQVLLTILHYLELYCPTHVSCIPVNLLLLFHLVPSLHPVMAFLPLFLSPLILLPICHKQFEYNQNIV